MWKIAIFSLLCITQLNAQELDSNSFKLISPRTLSDIARLSTTDMLLFSVEVSTSGRRLSIPPTRNGGAPWQWDEATNSWWRYVETQPVYFIPMPIFQPTYVPQTFGGFSFRRTSC
jgi:hypothetical protein